MESIAIRSEGMAIKLEVLDTGLEAIASRLKAIATRLEANNILAVLAALSGVAAELGVRLERPQVGGLGRSRHNPLGFAPFVGSSCS